MACSREGTGIFTFDSQYLSFSQDTLLTSKLIQKWMGMEGRGPWYNNNNNNINKALEFPCSLVGG
jgi:hypothetical protein